MKRSKFTESQIVFALQQAETGVAGAEVCRQLGVSEATFYNWKKKYGGLGPAELRRLRQLEEENLRLKQIVADLTLDKQLLRDVLKKAEVSAAPRVGRHVVGGVPGLGTQGLRDGAAGAHRLSLPRAAARRSGGTATAPRDGRDAG